MAYLLFLTLLIRPETQDEQGALYGIYNRQFVEAQENWVIDSMEPGHRMKGLVPMFGLKFERYVSSLSCLHYGCRETAVEEIKGMGEKAFIPLIWASRHVSSSVSGPARDLLREFYLCPQCNGDGYVTTSFEWYPCFICRAMGHLRFRYLLIHEKGYLYLNTSSLP